jgi:hypothetical protein
MQTKACGGLLEGEGDRCSRGASILSSESVLWRAFFTVAVGEFEGGKVTRGFEFSETQRRQTKALLCSVHPGHLVHWGVRTVET